MNTKTKTEAEKAGTAVAALGTGTAVGKPVDRKADAGRGKATSRDDKIVPMVKLLQSQSPQCLKQKAEYIKGAEAGDFYLKGAINPLVKGTDGLVVQPCAFLRCWLEFDGSRDANPKFVRRHEDAGGRPAGIDGLDLDENGFDFVDHRGHRYTFSREHYVLAGKNAFVIPFGGSAHIASREWNTMMDHYSDEASWNRKYKITTVPRSNESGDWFGFKIEALDGEVSDEEYLMGRGLHEAIEAGARSEAPDSSGSSQQSTDDRI